MGRDPEGGEGSQKPGFFPRIKRLGGTRAFRQLAGHRGWPLAQRDISSPAY